LILHKQLKLIIMNVKTHSIKFNADVKLLKHVQKKMDKLDKFFDRGVD